MVYWIFVSRSFDCCNFPNNAKIEKYGKNYIPATLGRWTDAQRWTKGSRWKQYTSLTYQSTLTCFRLLKIPWRNWLICLESHDLECHD